MDSNCRMLSASECALRYQVTRSTWYRMVDQGEAPEPVSNGNHKLWAISALVEWEDQVMAAYATESSEFSVSAG